MDYHDLEKIVMLDGSSFLSLTAGSINYFTISFDIYKIAFYMH